ncbi:MAG: NAD(P)/FAD-dependent oxidoreductase [Flavobacteriales bacterium]|nr:NAD(P)/FAD-dependent oxidoreductase [Flavobacteriales bacterium]
MGNKTEHIVIIGNGISGTTAARHIRKRNSSCIITIISSETKYFFSRTALMYVYMGHMKFEHTKPYEDSFWPKNRIDLVYGHVNQIDFGKKILKIDNNEEIMYDKLILALGSVPNKFGWPGQDLKGVQGLYSCQDLMLMETNTDGIEHAVVVGGGLIGIEMAEMLSSRGIKTTMLVREARFWGNILPEQESKLIERHIISHGIDLKLNHSLKEIKSNGANRVGSILTESGEVINCEFVGLTIGVRPNVDFLRGSGLEVNKGVVVNKFLETNQPNVYALGDCAEFKEAPSGRKNIEQVWYTGRMMGETLAKTITTSKTAYQPGNWFNSAKFFDIEYQTYGRVGNKLHEGESDFYWENIDGNKSLRIVYNSDSEAVIGINVFGIRLRHEVIDRWLTEKKKVKEVVGEWNNINFDPEFFKRYEKEIAHEFAEHFGISFNIKPKNWKSILNLVS